MGGKNHLQPDQSGDGSKPPGRRRSFLNLFARNDAFSKGSSSKAEAPGPPTPRDTDEKRPANHSNTFGDPDEQQKAKEPPPSYEAATGASSAYPFEGESSTSEKLPEYTITRDMVGENEHDPKILAHTDIVLLIDDSKSMTYDWNEGKEEALNAIMQIVPIAIEYDKDGIDLHFLNEKRAYTNITSTDEVVEAFKAASFDSTTPLADRLNTLLQAYLKKYQENTAIKPLSLIVITDGEPSLDDYSKKLRRPPRESVKYAIRDAVRGLIRINESAQKCQFGIQFFQVGSDGRATEFLKDLDDNLQNMDDFPEGWDVVDRATFREGETRLTKDDILKVLMGGVNKRLDQVETPVRKAVKDPYA